MEDDLIIGEESDELDLLDVIDSQLDIIIYVSDIDNDMYDTCLADKIKVTTKAFSVILKAQAKLLKNL
jgi:hypothetical protein